MHSPNIGQHIVEYDLGELDEQEAVELFEHLLDNGRSLPDDDEGGLNDER